VYVYLFIYVQIVIALSFMIELVLQGHVLVNLQHGPKSKPLPNYQ